MKKFYRFLRLLWFTNRISAKPNDTNLVFALYDFLLKSRSQKQIQKIEKRLQANSDFVKFEMQYKSNNFITNSFILQELRRYPSNSLGQMLYQFCKANDIVPEYFHKLEEKNKLVVIRNYLMKTHDLLHILTGFDTTPEGEYGLQAFYLAQESSLASFCTMLAGALEIIKKGQLSRIGSYMDNLARGWSLGRRAKKLLYVNWDMFLPMPLETVKVQFLIVDR
jgi:ubiquinone biosynthesis protein Coq4